jgi:ankyrin repeat protein
VTALHRAAGNGHRPVVQLFLDDGSDIEIKDILGQTRLHHAAQNEHEPVVQLLLDF